jgi:imidazole glycerol-phosphate synthase subunit HisH
MQLMARQSEEGNIPGLGWINADVARFNISDCLKYKVPHIGWNQVTVKKDHPLMNNISTGAEFYFVHSFHYKTTEMELVLNETEYEYSFVSAIQKENIMGVQYHPEKSHNAGLTLLSNFINL